MTKLMPRLALLLILLSSQLAWTQMPPMSDGASRPVVADNCQHHGDSAVQGSASSKAHAGCQHDGQCHCAHFSASPLVPSSGVLLSPAPHVHLFLSAVVDSAAATEPFKPWRPPAVL